MEAVWHVGVGGRTMARMNVCVWFDATDGPWGGGNQFLRALTARLTELGHEVTKTPDGSSDVILLNAHCCGPGRVYRLREVAQVRGRDEVSWWGQVLPRWRRRPRRRRRPVLVHRVDGVAEVIRGFRTRADRIQARVNKLTDYTIFQSAYCREICAAHGILPRQSSLIRNGADPRIFFPHSDRRSDARPLRLVASSWSPNPRKGFARLADISRIPGVEVRFVGQWCQSVESANVVCVGAMASRGVAEVLRDSDAMIHAAEDEPCSNAILEALACGLPILYLDSGGNREVAGDYGVPLSGDYEADIEQLRAAYLDLRGRVLEDRWRFLVTRAAEEYIEVFERALALRGAGVV